MDRAGAPPEEEEEREAGGRWMEGGRP